MRPLKHILLCAPDSIQASVLKVVFGARLHVVVKHAEGLGVVAALHEIDPFYRPFYCAVLLRPYPQTVQLLRKYEIPTLAVGVKSDADRTVMGDMAEVIEAVRIICARKRGPKPREAVA